MEVEEVTPETPEVVLEHQGFRIPVSGFLSRIDPSDIGDIKPHSEEAHRIVSIQEEYSWRKLSLCNVGVGDL